LDKLYKDQAKFTEKVLGRLIGHFPLNHSEKIQWTKEYLLCLIKECTEVLDVLDWKHHYHDGRELNLSNLGIECIDIQKYLWGLMTIWGFDYEQFETMYEIKSLEVEQKFFQNNILPKISEISKVCVIDIDGVLCEYPSCFYDWVIQNYSIDVLKHTRNPIEWEKYKNLYREMGGKRNIKPNLVAVDRLQEIKDSGYTIVLLTNRPVHKYKRIYSDTIYWLDKNKIPYDYILWAEDKKISTIFKGNIKVEFAVDDCQSILDEYNSLNIRTFLQIPKLSEL
jgi:hypothetical protein